MLNVLYIAAIVGAVYATQQNLQGYGWKAWLAAGVVFLILLVNRAFTLYSVSIVGSLWAVFQYLDSWKAWLAAGLISLFLLVGRTFALFVFFLSASIWLFFHYLDNLKDRLAAFRSWLDAWVALSTYYLDEWKGWIAAGVVFLLFLINRTFALYAIPIAASIWGVVYYLDGWKAWLGIAIVVLVFGLIGLMHWSYVLEKRRKKELERRAREEAERRAREEAERRAREEAMKPGLFEFLLELVNIVGEIIEERERKKRMIEEFERRKSKYKS